MIVELTEREQTDVIRGTVTGSNVECVVLRADLFERVRFLFDESPDAAIHEMAGVIADISPEDWKSAEEWRRTPESKRLNVFLCALRSSACRKILCTAEERRAQRNHSARQSPTSATDRQGNWSFPVNETKT